MWAVVPLKSPERAKTRLAAVFSPQQREQLLFALGERVIGALQATPGIDEVAVVTASTRVAAFARELGAHPILQADESGTTSAFIAGLKWLEDLRLPRVLLITGDLPLVSPSALEQVMLAAGGERGVVVVPDRRRRCTNALLLAPPDAVAPCFGTDSFRRNLAAASAGGLTARVVEHDELGLDLDLPEDLDHLQALSGIAANQLLQACALRLPREHHRLPREQWTHGC